MFVVRIVDGRAPRGAVRFGSGQFVTEWEPIRMQGDSRQLYGAHVPDDHPEIEWIRRQAGQQRLTEIHPDSIVIRLAAASAAPPPAVAAEVDDAVRRLAYLVQIAERHGWTQGDLTGTAEGGEPGEAGGRSLRTGLTMAEMTLTRPPRDWAELAERGRPPWESADWQPPTPTWAHPAWPEKVLDPSDPAPIEPGEITDRDAYEQAKAEGKIAEIAPDSPAASAPVSSTIVPLESEKTEPDDDENDDDPLATYPADQLEQMRAVVTDLAARNGGKVPHVNAVNFLLTKKHDPPLAAVKSAQIRAVLASTTTT